MRLDIKMAIVKSGFLPQYKIAQELGVQESRLSKYIGGYGYLHPDHIAKLYEILRLKTTDKESASESQ